MNINFKQLDSYLQNNTSHLNFFLIGDDFGQVIYVTETLLKNYFDNEERHIEKIEYSALQKDNSLLQNHMQSLQLFSEKKAIIIKNVGNAFKKEIIEIIKNSNNKFLLIIQAESLKKSSKPYKDFESIGKFCFINCYKLDLYATIHFIETFLKKHIIKFDTEIVNIIANSLPDNLLLINNELEKLVQYLGHEKELTVEIVHDVISGTKELVYINICHALIFKDKNGLLEQLKRIQDTNFISMIRIIQSYFSKVLFIKSKEIYENKRVDFIINSMLPPIFFKEKKIFLDICNKISLKKALNFMEELTELELNCKKSFASNSYFIFNQYLIQKVQ